jgi:periplasmic protein TonB
VATYRGTAEKKDRAKALAGVVLVHAALGALILSGLSVSTVSAAVERLKTFNITETPPPPPIVEPPPPPRPDESSAPKDEAAPANIRSRPTPVVAPTPPIPLPIEQRIRTAEVRGPEGLDRTAGAANVRGPGTGAGGQGLGFGGGGAGGTGTGAGYTPARRISKIPDREYRRIVAASGMSRGTIGLTLKVERDGRPSDCRIARSSGNSGVDSLFCQLALQHVRFRPARDPEGRPVAQDITWYPDWYPNR